MFHNFYDNYDHINEIEMEKKLLNDVYWKYTIFIYI